MKIAALAAIIAVTNKFDLNRHELFDEAFFKPLCKQVSWTICWFSQNEKRVGSLFPRRKSKLVDSVPNEPEKLFRRMFRLVFVRHHSEANDDDARSNVELRLVVVDVESLLQRRGSKLNTIFQQDFCFVDLFYGFNFDPRKKKLRLLFWTKSRDRLLSTLRTNIGSLLLLGICQRNSSEGDKEKKSERGWGRERGREGAEGGKRGLAATAWDVEAEGREHSLLLERGIAGRQKDSSSSSKGRERERYRHLQYICHAQTWSRIPTVRSLSSVSEWDRERGWVRKGERERERAREKGRRKTNGKRSRRILTESVSAGSFPSPSFEAYECCLLPGTLCRSQKLEVLCNIGCRVAYKGRKTGEEKKRRWTEPRKFR